MHSVQILNYLPAQPVVHKTQFPPQLVCLSYLSTPLFGLLIFPLPANSNIHMAFSIQKIIAYMYIKKYMTVRMQIFQMQEMLYQLLDFSYLVSLGFVEIKHLAFMNFSQFFRSVFPETHTQLISSPLKVKLPPEQCRLLNKWIKNFYTNSVFTGLTNHI